MPAEVVSLDAHRPTPRPAARFVALDDGSIELEIRLDDGSSTAARLSIDQTVRLILQGTDAVDVASHIRRL